MDALPCCSRWAGTTQMDCHRGKKYHFATHPIGIKMTAVIFVSIGIDHNTVLC